MEDMRCERLASLHEFNLRTILLPKMLRARSMTVGASTSLIGSSICHKALAFV